MAASLPPPSPSPPPPSPLQISPSASPTPNNVTPNSPKSISPTKKSQPVPWTHQETINLIQAYQQKWYSLRKGQLKASQWQEVADAVTKRCHYSSKSVTQCRHKIEKLRKRYRAEKIKSFPNSWPYFDLMDRMERGPLPRPVDHYNPNSCSSDSDFLDDNKSKSLNHIVRGGVGNTRFINNDYYNNAEKSDRDSRSPIVRSDVVVAQLAVEIRAVSMEHKKMEMMSNMERYREEMENKRMEVILESQRKLVHTIRKALSGGGCS